MGEKLSPYASLLAPSRRVRVRLWVLALVPVVVVASMMGWLPRGPIATADHHTWALFGQPAAPGHWVTGDGSYPVALPDGRVAWLFGDSLVRRADGGDTFVHNTIVVQDDDGRLHTLAGGSSTQPADLIPPVQPGTWLWPASGFVEYGRLLVFAEEFTAPAGASGEQSFHATNRRYLVPFQLPDLRAGAPRPVYDGPVAWGHAVLVSGGDVYVYGNLQRDGWTNLTYLARFRLGQSAGYWQFWDGSRFSPNLLAATPLRGPDGSPLVAKLASVIPYPSPTPDTAGGVAALTIDPFGTTIDLRVAAYPQGPWSAKHTLYTVREDRPYLPRARARADGVVQLAYSVADSRPRYLTVRW